jgi:ribonuclease P protein component
MRVELMESDNAEENVSTKQSPTRQKARVSCPDGDQERTRSYQAPPREGPQAPDGPALLGFSLSKEARLAKRAEFLRVYDQGRRIEGRFMTVFILPNRLPQHRVGVTATKKAIGKAHDRNRAKRLLRESFRLSRVELDGVPQRFDWVLNARRSLLHATLEKPLAEFRNIVGRLATEHTEKEMEQQMDTDKHRSGN